MEEFIEVDAPPCDCARCVRESANNRGVIVGSNAFCPEDVRLFDKPISPRPTRKMCATGWPRAGQVRSGSWIGSIRVWPPESVRYRRPSSTRMGSRHQSFAARIPSRPANVGTGRRAEECLPRGPSVSMSRHRFGWIFLRFLSGGAGTSSSGSTVPSTLSEGKSTRRTPADTQPAGLGHMVTSPSSNK